MDPNELLDLQELPEVMPDLAPFIPIEAFPIEALPVAAAVGWFTRILFFFSKHAFLLAFLGAMIENTVLLGFLLPGGTVVALSAAGGRTANLSLPLLVIVSALGMTCGAVIDYYLGRAGLHQLLHKKWTGKWGKRLARQLTNAEPLLRRHGWWVMLFAHAFGHGRSSLALAAGASGFPLTRFLIIEVPAALLWAGLYAGGGYFLAGEWQHMEFLLRRLGWIGAAIVVIGFAGYWFWQRRTSADEGDEGEDETQPASEAAQPAVAPTLRPNGPASAAVAVRPADAPGSAGPLGTTARRSPSSQDSRA